jgi:hypothetical protein
MRIFAPSRSGRRAYRDRHETWNGMRWTRECRETNGTHADGEAVWFWRPDAGAKLATMLSHCADDGDKKARSHREDHGVSRKPSRREGRIVSADL